MWTQRLRRVWRGVTPQTITHPHFGPESVAVLAIDVTGADLPLGAPFRPDAMTLASRPVARAGRYCSCGKIPGPGVFGPRAACHRFSFQSP